MKLMRRVITAILKFNIKLRATATRLGNQTVLSQPPPCSSFLARCRSSLSDPELSPYTTRGRTRELVLPLWKRLNRNRSHMERPKVLRLFKLLIKLALIVCLLLVLVCYVHAMHGCRLTHYSCRQPQLNVNGSKLYAHQIWLSHEVPRKLIEYRQTCKNVNSNYEMLLWTGDSIERHIQLHHPELLGLFRSYPHDIERVDSARYILLHDFGGVYMDLDVTCTDSVDKFTERVASDDKIEVVLISTEPVGVTNSVIVALKPHSSFMCYMINRLCCTKGYYLTPYWTVMFSTGSVFVWRSLEAYTSVFKSKDVELVKPAIADQYFVHHHASLWHGWDGPLMLLFEAHGKAIVCLLLLTLIVFLIALKRRRNKTPMKYFFCVKADCTGLT